MNNITRQRRITPFLLVTALSIAFISPIGIGVESANAETARSKDPIQEFNIEEYKLASSMPDTESLGLLGNYYEPDFDKIFIVYFADADISIIEKAKLDFPHEIVVSKFSQKAYQEASNLATQIGLAPGSEVGYGFDYDPITDTILVEGAFDQSNISSLTDTGYFTFAPSAEGYVPLTGGR